MRFAAILLLYPCFAELQCVSTDDLSCDREGSDELSLSQWGSGFLQETYQVREREERQLSVSVVTATKASAEKPLSSASWELIDRALFGSRIVHFPWCIYAGVFGFFVIVFFHEVHVSRGGVPICQPKKLEKSIGCQLMGLWTNASPFVAMSMQVPISLDFALSLRQGATSSGFFLSCGVITGLCAMAAGKRLVDEENWNQFYVRRLLIVIPLIAMALSFASAIFINETSGSEQVYLIWWVMIGFTVAGSFIGPLSVIPGIIFWTKITKSKNRTFWMILTQCARNLGLVVGPGLFAVLRTAVTGGGDRVCPRSMMGWVNLTLLVFSLISASFGAFVMPARMPDYPLNLEEDDEDDPDELVMASDAHLEAMPEPERERVVWNMIWYAFERPFTLAAVEVSTLMMLEVYYGWDPYMTGICFTAVCSLGIVMSIGTTVALVKGWVIESHVFIISAASSIIGCLFLVEIVPTPGWTLLIADCIIYTGATVANGFAEGWASRAAKEGTSFSNAEYRLRQLSAVTVSRFMGPIVGRFLVDYGGRNVYAVAQLVMCLMGTRTVYKTVGLIWRWNRANPQVSVKDTEVPAAEKLLKGEEQSKIKNGSPIEAAPEDQ